MTSESMPLVSVIIPTYNRAHTLPRSLGSVLAQTYTNIEVLVIDDGSTDDTETYISNINDNRVRYIKNPSNSGPAFARNRGAALAEGDIIAFQDSDDEWPADKLEKQMPLLLDDPSVQMVYCRIEKFSGDKLLIVTPSDSMPLEQKQGDLLISLLNTPLIGTPTVVVWKERFLELGGFKEFLHAFEDYEFSIRFAEKYRIAFADNTFVKVHASSDGVNQRFSEIIKADMYIVEEMIEQLRQHDLLMKRIALVGKRAFYANCYDLFCEEARCRLQLFSPAEQSQIQQLLLDLPESLRMQNEAEKQRREIYEPLQRLAEAIKVIHIQYTQNNALSDSELDETLQGIITALYDFIDFLGLTDSALRSKINTIKEKLDSDTGEKPALLMELYSIITLIEQQAHNKLVT